MNDFNIDITYHNINYDLIYTILMNLNIDNNVNNVKLYYYTKSSFENNKFNVYYKVNNTYKYFINIV